VAALAFGVCTIGTQADVTYPEQLGSELTNASAQQKSETHRHRCRWLPAHPQSASQPVANQTTGPGQRLTVVVPRTTCNTGLRKGRAD
jgi:hypothetical protein